MRSAYFLSFKKLEGNISCVPDAFILDDNTAFYTPISFGNHRISNIAMSSSLMHCHWSCFPIITRVWRWLCETSFIFRKIWMLLYILTLKWGWEGTENEYLSVHGVHNIAEKYSGMWRNLVLFSTSTKNETSVMYITLLFDIFIYLFCFGKNLPNGCLVAALMPPATVKDLIVWKDLPFPVRNCAEMEMLQDICWSHLVLLQMILFRRHKYLDCDLSPL